MLKNKIYADLKKATKNSSICQIMISSLYSYGLRNNGGYN